MICSLTGPCAFYVVHWKVTLVTHWSIRMTGPVTLSWGEAHYSLEDTLLFTSAPWHTQLALSSELEAVSRNLEILANWKPLGAAVSHYTVSPLLSRLPCTSTVCFLFCALWVFVSSSARSRSPVTNFPSQILSGSYTGMCSTKPTVESFFQLSFCKCLVRGNSAFVSSQPLVMSCLTNFVI